MEEITAYKIWAPTRVDLSAVQRDFSVFGHTNSRKQRLMMEELVMLRSIVDPLADDKSGR